MIKSIGKLKFHGGGLMKINAYAKINLMLDIIKKTEDGYHTLFMIMQSVGIYDEITVTIGGQKDSISLTCSEASLPCDKKNIAYKAACRFFEYTGAENPGIQIHIEKHIPFAAGLAGGSADGAAVIMGLNRLLGTNLSVEELCKIGVKVGADVPFCLKGGTMAAMDIGEVLAPLPPIGGMFFVLVKPHQDVSTKEAYDAFDSAINIRHSDRDGIVRALATGDNKKMYTLIQNVFEQFVEVPERVEIKACMRRFGAVATCMSGSGPTVYGIFESEISARSCANELSKNFEEVFVCEPKTAGLEVVENISF